MLFFTIRRAKRAIREIAGRYCPIARVFSFGATNISPRFLAIYVTTWTDEERDLLRSQPDLKDEFRQALFAAGYPAWAVPHVGLAFESQETVNDFGGSWYLACK
jgi:hypothetical protein